MKKIENKFQPESEEDCLSLNCDNCVYGENLYCYGVEQGWVEWLDYTIW